MFASSTILLRKILQLSFSFPVNLFIQPHIVTIYWCNLYVDTGYSPPFILLIFLNSIQAYILHTMECKRCIVCGSEAPKFCSGCKNVCYCSKEHQKLHWNHHKASCRNYKVEYCDYEEEHHFVASMNIKAGTIT